MKRAFRENTGRVLSIAAIHDILTGTDHGDRVELRPLLEKIRRNLQSMSPQGQEIVISIQGDDMAVSSHKATSIALVVNELLTNALEHGYEGRAEGRVTVTLLRGRESSTITVEDDGSGFSPAQKREDSLGLDIITLTVRDKLGGELQLQSGPGGTKAMTFAR
jgi:two-component sensor histidine kinase